MNSVKNILSVKNIVKTYPGVIAINDVSFDVEEGEIHALIGENGAGKSTLIKVLSGAIVPDSGTIELEGKKYNQMTPKLAKDLGIEVIYQEFTLVPGISAAENVFLGDKTKPGAFCDIKDREARAKKIFDDLQVDIDVSRPVKTMSPAHQQLVEIAKAVSRNVKILIMDEPTAPLTVAVSYCAGIKSKRCDDHLHLPPVGGAVRTCGPRNGYAGWLLCRYRKYKRHRQAEADHDDGRP